MKIQEVCEKTGLTKRTISFYEEKGLISQKSRRAYPLRLLLLLFVYACTKGCLTSPSFISYLSFTAFSGIAVAYSPLKHALQHLSSPISS